MMHIRTASLALILCLMGLGGGSCTNLGCGSSSTRPSDDPGESADQDEQPEAREISISLPPAEGSDSSLLSASPPSLVDVLGQIRAVADQDHVRGLLLRVGPLHSLARARELHDALSGVRSSGKPIHCHFDQADNASYWLLATSCDRINMTPGGTLNLVGFAIQGLYFRDALTRLGIHAELLQMGRFKGAADPLTRSDMPHEVRETLGRVLDDFGQTLISGITAHRPIADENATRAIVDSGPFDAISAREAQLVDDVGFVDEAREHLRQAASVPRVRTVRLRPRAPEVGIGDLLGALSGESPDVVEEGPRLAIVRLTGAIVDAEAEGTGTGGQARQSGPFVRAMHRLGGDSDVLAVVLRIDSPGGSALASDQMWHAVRSLSHRKPVIVSVGSMAASGGYYIASAGTHLFAQPESLVGSIGVVGGKIEVSELLDQIGIHSVILSRNANAAWASPTRPWTEAQRALVYDRMQRTYHLFLRRIHSVRPDADLVHAAAGRLMTARSALPLGLVDELGGLLSATAYARNQVGLPDDCSVELWPPTRSPLERLAKLMGGNEASVSPLGGSLRRSDALSRSVSNSLSNLLEIATILQRENVAVALPFQLTIE